MHAPEKIYKGYYQSNPGDFTDWKSDKSPQLPDMDVVTVGLNVFYIFNSESCSKKAAFTRNQV